MTTIPRVVTDSVGIKYRVVRDEASKIMEVEQLPYGQQTAKAIAFLEMVEWFGYLNLIRTFRIESQERGKGAAFLAVVDGIRTIVYNRAEAAANEWNTL